MPDLVIKEAELAQLDQFIGQLPTIYGMQLVKFFDAVHNARQQEALVSSDAAVGKENLPVVGGLTNVKKTKASK